MIDRDRIELIFSPQSKLVTASWDGVLKLFDCKLLLRHPFHWLTAFARQKRQPFGERHGLIEGAPASPTFTAPPFVLHGLESRRSGTRSGVRGAINFPVLDCLLQTTTVIVRLCLLLPVLSLARQPPTLV